MSVPKIGLKESATISRSGSTSVDQSRSVRAFQLRSFGFSESVRSSARRAE
ncbi:hypothetical protein BH11MYX4_BH11MYX4_46960 [soil metagenome]